ncbi:hypothetical protein IND94_003667 [Salmonella enterica]|nr:hypothetical protein [Salmonella enterica]
MQIIVDAGLSDRRLATLIIRRALPWLTPPPGAVKFPYTWGATLGENIAGIYAARDRGELDDDAAARAIEFVEFTEKALEEIRAREQRYRK